MTKTLLLDPVTWDLCVDAKGNIAAATNPYAIAQNAATRCRLFLGDNYYNQTDGIPFLQQILAKPANLQVLKGLLIAAAKQGDAEIVDAQVFFAGFSPANRRLTGQIQVTNRAGQSSFANF